MTWWFDPHGDYMDVYDHNGTLVADQTAIAYDDDGNPVGSWSEYPDRVKEIARDTMDGNQPSGYNESLIADMSTDNIEQGTPPE